MKKAMRDLVEHCEINRTHEHGKPCPVTDKPIPLKRGIYIWTDRSREGFFNSCYACNEPKHGKEG
jgi:hypothetical protein